MEGRAGGTVTLRSRIDDGMMVIEVEDDGVGMHAGGEFSPSGAGIGMRNVRDRMEVQYGSRASVEINSRPGRGTKVTLRMPVLDSTANMQAGPHVLGMATEAVDEVMRRVTRVGVSER